jgi:hypothetical protein
MSHCTSFNMCFMDKRTLFKAMRNLGWQPENEVWIRYQSQIDKRLNINGNITGKLLTGEVDGINVFFIESRGGFIPHFESHIVAEGDLKIHGQKIISLLKREYVRCCVKDFVKAISESGVTATYWEESRGNTINYEIMIGETNKVLEISLDNQNIIQETVKGISGKSCIDLTGLLEQKLADPENFNRSWTHEYNEIIEDQIVQVLKLR